MTDTRNIPISKIEANKGQIEGLPKNPRKKTRIEALVRSISDAPEMLTLRELLVVEHGAKFVAIGGNMRLAACKKLGYREVPCKVLPADTPVEKLREYVIKDNAAFGENDWAALQSDWDASDLTAWGMELPDDWGGGEPETKEKKPKDGGGECDGNEDDTPILDLLFPSDNDFEIPALLPEWQGGRLELPVTPWGANSRLNAGVNTYHFYVDDYRFEALFKDPSKLVCSGVKAIVEPNCSLHDQTPIAYGLQLIYKKRWLARYMQEVGTRVYVDLNVSRKFADYNLLGVPQGWDAFFTRGLADMLGALEIDLDAARRVSGKDTPNLTVYGGGRKAEEFCQKHGLLYVTDFINAKKINK